MRSCAVWQRRRLERRFYRISRSTRALPEIRCGNGGALRWKPEALENTIRIAEQREPAFPSLGRYTQLPYAGEVCERAAYLRYLTYKGGRARYKLDSLEERESEACAEDHEFDRA